MTYAYKLAGKAASASADFIPSLIGVKEDQREPGANDTYFEQFEVENFDASAVTSVERTRMVCYDSLPRAVRDPILAVKGRGFAFYITATEAVVLAGEDDDPIFFEMLCTVTSLNERAAAFA